MKTWVVRFLSLLVFNIVVLLVIGWLTPARVGFSAFWGGVILTAATIWVKPAVHGWFTRMSAKSVVAAHKGRRVARRVRRSSTSSPC